MSSQIAATYRCVACNLFFNNFDEQRQHYFVTHQNQQQSQRPIPSLTTNNPSGFPRPFPNTFAPNASYLKGNHEKTLSSNSFHPGNGSYEPMKARTVFLSKTKPKSFSIRCDICDVDCTSRSNYDIHIQGKKHIKMLGKVEGNKDVPKPNSNLAVVQSDLHCKICEITCSAIDQLNMHLTGSKHNKKLKMNKFEELKVAKDPSVYCEMCDQFMHEDTMAKHKEGGKHKRKNHGKIESSPKKKAKMSNSGIPVTLEYCGYCLLNLTCPEEAISHYQSSKHIMNLQNRSKDPELWCDVCQTSFHNKEILDKHLNGFKHFARMNRGNKNPEGDLGPKLINQRLKLQALKNRKKTDIKSGSESEADKSKSDEVKNEEKSDESKEVN